MILSFLLLYWNLSKEDDRTYAYIQACIIWSVYLFFMTEFLSILSLIKPIPLLCAWLGFAVILLALLIYRKRYRELFRFSFKFTPAALGIGLLMLLGLIVLRFSLATTPYNWDSMTYHLPRITHWAQNGSVAHYATHILRQISSPVLAEFVNLHVYILTAKSDILFNLLQGVSYLTCACMVYRITLKLHGSQGTGLLATLLYMSMPIAVSEALTTQTDHFSALWLLYFMYLLLDFTNPGEKIRFDSSTVRKVCMMGCCVSLGYLTKPSVCIAMALSVLWLLLHCILRKDSPQILCKLIGCTIPTIVLPLLPETLRNLHTFSALSDPGVGKRQLIGTLHPLYVLVNFLKNFTFNMPWHYIPNSENLLLRLVRKAASVLRVDLNAPSISEDGRDFFLHGSLDYGHDTAVNPLILYLLILCILLGLWACRRYSVKRIVLGYSFIATACFMVFCAVLRWEPFVSRYMLSYLALLCPMIAIQLHSRLPRIARCSLTVVVILLCFIDLSRQSAYDQLMMTKWGANQRPYGYFANRNTEYDSYFAICEVIKDKDYASVGLFINVDDYEYPLWEMLLGQTERIEHIGVTNESMIYADDAFQPDCIIWLGSKPTEPYEYNGKTYGECTEYQERHYLLCP